jgi:hypothetical protein
MPTVPTLTGPQVESRPLAPRFQDGSGATAQNFGVGLGAGLDQAGRRISGAGDELAKLALQIQIDDNERDAKRLDVELSSTLRTINYGDGTAQNPGYFGKRGENAINSFADTQKQIQDAHQKLLQSAKNDRVRQMYGDVANKRIEQEFNTMSRFVGQERRAAADTLSEARMQEAAANASVAWNNPEVLRQSLGIALGEAKSMAERNGWSPEVLAAKEREAKTVIASSAIKAALAVEATGKASTLFKQFQGDMTAEVRNSLQKQIREGSVAGSAMALAKQAESLFPGNVVDQLKWLRDQKVDPRAATQAFGQITAYHNAIKSGQQEQLRGTSQATFDRIVASTADPNERLRLARQLPNPEERDAVEARLNNENSRERQQQNDQDNAVTRALRQVQMDETIRLRQEREENQKAYKEADDVLREHGSTRLLSPELRGKLKPEQIHALEVREQQLARGEKFAPESNDEKLRGYMTMAPGDLANLSQAELRANLTEQDYNVVETLRKQSILGKRDPKDPISLPSRISSRITETFGQASETEKKHGGKIRRMIEEEITREQGETKKPLTAQRENEIINSVFDKVVLTGGGMLWGDSDPTARFKVKVPDTDRQQIIDAYRVKYTRRPTELEIVNAYVAKTNAPKAK